MAKVDNFTSPFFLPGLGNGMVSPAVTSQMGNPATATATAPVTKATASATAPVTKETTEATLSTPAAKLPEQEQFKKKLKKKKKKHVDDKMKAVENQNGHKSKDFKTDQGEDVHGKRKKSKKRKKDKKEKRRKKERSGNLNGEQQEMEADEVETKTTACDWNTTQPAKAKTTKTLKDAKRTDAPKKKKLKNITDKYAKRIHGEKSGKKLGKPKREEKLLGNDRAKETGKTPGEKCKDSDGNKKIAKTELKRPVEVSPTEQQDVEGQYFLSACNCYVFSSKNEKHSQKVDFSLFSQLVLHLWEDISEWKR